MKYRKEIDGLRAIAVLAVLFFHAGLFGVTGGYVGVDVFFVISGYLITSIILEEIYCNNFSLLNFYERRARRILPALSVVLLVTSILAFIFMPAYLLKSYSQSLASVATFFSNVYFYLTAGYFAAASDEKPLLHTWSLAVEEQYYIFFPILLSLLWGLGKKNIAKIVSILAILSLLLSQHLSNIGVLDANFYLIFSRAWELFAGSLIAILGIDKYRLGSTSREILGITGLALILYSITFFNKQTPFPSLYALIPVIGTALIISFTDKTTLVGRVLAAKWIVGIGLISYSLYLWHQPILAFLRMKTIGEPTLFAVLFALGLVFILSIFTYKYVEQPFRNKKTIPRKAVIFFSIASTASFFVFGMSGHFFDGYPNRFSPSKYLKTVQFSPKRNECHTFGRNYLKPTEACTYHGDNVTWASFGDSHSVEPAFALATLLQEKNEGLLHLSFSGCPPALSVKAKEPGCSEWIEESLTYLENSKSIKSILLGFRHNVYLYGDQLSTYPNPPSQDPNQYLYTSKLIKDLREAYWVSFNTIVKRLTQSGKKVHILYPVPELPMHISKLLAPFSTITSEPMLDPKKATTAKYYFERNHLIINELDALPYGNNLQAIKPFTILCNEEYCPAVINNTALYFDDDHLSVEGAGILLNASELISKEN